MDGTTGRAGDKGGCQALREMEALPEAGERQGPGAHLTHVCEPREEGREWPGPAVTFVARVHPLCQQHAAQLALGALLVAHLGQVGRHAERVVADFALVVFADTAEEGTMRGLGLRPKESSFIAGYLSPSDSGYVSAILLFIAWTPAEQSQAPHLGTQAEPDVLPRSVVCASVPPEGLEPPTSLLCPHPQTSGDSEGSIGESPA